MWAGIGYHYVIDDDGVIYRTEPVEVASAHIWGLTESSLGVCLCGDFTDHPPNAAQLTACHDLLAWFKQTIGKNWQYGGHKDFALPESPTACPGDRWCDWKEEVLPK